jgi:hypothetical protein
MKTWRNDARGCLVVLVLAAPAAARPEPDRLTPADAEVVLTVNVRRMLQAPVVQKHALDPLKLLLRRNDELRRLLEAAGLDPLKDVDTISLSTSGNPTAGGKLLAVVRGRFDPDKARTAAAEYARKNPGRLKDLPGTEPAMWQITSDGKSLFAAFADKNVLVMTASKEDTAAVVRRADQPPQALTKDMQAALDQIKDCESAWLAMTVTGPMRQLLKNDELAREFADAVQSVTGSLDLGDDARLELVVHTNSPAAAGRIKDKLDDLMKLATFLAAGKDSGSRVVKEVIDGIKVDTERSDAAVRLRLTDAQIERAHKKE